jgi:hypothetical protein
MKYSKNQVSFGQNVRDTPAPGANVAPLPAASVANGRVTVQSNPGEPAPHVHPKSEQVPTHPAHAKPGRVADGSKVLEAGAVAASCTDCNDSAE